MADGDFEARLRADLPRGHTVQPKSGGRERALFARWLTSPEMTGDLWQPESGLERRDGRLFGWPADRHGLLLGRRDSRLTGWGDDRHVMTIAGSRAGKGVSLIVPNLVFYEGSALVIDPKGENACITARRRGAGPAAGGPGLGQDVYVLDPFEITGIESACFNPLNEIDLSGDNFASDAALFADALIIIPERGERHWAESAQGLLRALILVALADPEPARRNLITVRRLLMLTDQSIQYKVNPPLSIAEAKGREHKQITALQALREILTEQQGPHRDICLGVAGHLENMGDRELGGVLSTAITQTQWLDDMQIRYVLGRSDFRLADLKLKPTTIYLCLEAMRMGTHARWLRLMILLALTVMERTKVKPPAPVLFVLDEFPVLGYIQAIETAAGLMAGFGVKLWTILQNIGQLKRHYEHTWQTFMANSGVLTAFGVVDQETLEALSKRLGHMRMVEQVSTGAVGSALTSGAAAFRDDRRDVPLLADYEISLIFKREQNRMLVHGAGCMPAVTERFTYYEDDTFKGLYDEVPV
jgi:type IV secretion system protein VirD4